MQMKWFVVLSLLIPLTLSANVSITEIMYDVPGSDAGREWIEVRANRETDFSGWKLFEAHTNHALTIMKGTAFISDGGFAIIAENAEKFLADFPTFSGTLFDSSFSLSNTGETIVLRDNTGTSTDSFSYASSWGAGGDGNSLQRDGAVWTYGIPTPGIAFIKKKEEPVAPKKEDAGNIPSPLLSEEERTDARPKNETKEISSATGAAAAPAELGISAPAKEAKNNSRAWWGALVAITILAVGSVIWVRAKERPAASKGELSADDFDIIDITEK